MHFLINKLYPVYHFLCKAFNNNLLSCIVFDDVSKAIDRVWHKGVVFKLRRNGIGGKLLQCLRRYLNNRKQKITFESYAGSIKLNLEGVPQKSVVGSLLLLYIYINGIAKQLSLTGIFADNSMLLHV